MKKLMYFSLCTIYLFLFGLCIGQLYYKNIEWKNTNVFGKLNFDMSVKKEYHDKIKPLYIHNYIEVTFPNMESNSK